MDAVRLTPPDFEPPAETELGGLFLRVLGVDDLVPDFEAVSESVETLPGLFSPADTWPQGLTIRQNLLDLAWHEKEFQRGSSYSWGLWAAAGGRYLGSAYVYPDPTGAAAAHAPHWIRAGEPDRARRDRFDAAWRAWVSGWPLASVRFDRA